MADTGIQPYSASRIDYLAKYLQSLLPGLDYNVATTWIKSEKGVSGNVLGTTYNDASGQHLFTYPSQEAGLRAAAGWINTRSIYSGIKGSLGQSSTAQASAIANSPWNRSYYKGVFANLISPTGSSNPGGGASTPTTPSPNDPSVLTLSVLDKAFATLGFAKGDYRLSSSEVDKLKSYLTAQGVNPNYVSGQSSYASLAAAAGNNPNNSLVPGFTDAANSFIGSFDIGAAIMFIGVVLVGITLIGTGGLVMLKGKS